MNKIARLFLALIMTCVLGAAMPFTALAADTATYETYQTASGGFLRINRFTNTLDGAVNITGDLTIPSAVGTAKVETIADGTFYGCDELISVTVPSSVKSIGDRAFGACTSLKTVTLGEGLESLGKNAFQYCYSLTDISLPSTLKSIESYTFTNCLALPSITVPSSVKSIGSYAFSGCKNLASVSLPEGAVTIGDYAFSGCQALTSITLPKSLIAVPTALFEGCTALASVTLYGDVLTIGQNAFGNCTSLTKLVLPSGVQRIEQWAFSGCTNLKILSVPNSVKSISADAFSDWRNVTLYVNAGSNAQVFASANGFNFVLGALDDGGNGGGGGGSTEQYPATPFTDVANHWAKSYIEWAYAKKYFSGITDTTFAPNTYVNRGMMVSLLYRIEGSPSAGNSAFTDVAAKSYYADAVAWASANNIVSGITSATFGPSRNITREQVAAMLYRYAQYRGMDTTKRGDLSGFKDTDRISTYAGTAVSWAVGSGIITGMDQATLSPQGNATRAQVAVMLKKFTDMMK